MLSLGRGGRFLSCGIRRRLFDILDGHPEDSGWAGACVHYGILTIIVVSVGTMILETVPEIRHEREHLFFLIDIISLKVFLFEYVLRVWTSTEDRSGRFSKPFTGRLRYMVTPLALIDLMAFLPSLFFVFSGVDLRFLRLFRLMQLLKLVRYSPALATVGRVVWSERRSVVASFIVMITMVVISSTVMWMIEHTAQPEKFRSIPDAMWWAMATLTTVGYGDIAPVTALGRFVGGFVMLLGIGMFTLPAAILAGGFAQEIKRSDFIVSFDRIAHIPIFQRLKANQIAVLTRALHTQIFPQDYLLIHRDEQPKALYIIVEGEVRMTMDHAERILGPGEVFGALADFGNHEAYHAHIKTDSQCRIMILDFEDFTRLLTQFPDLRDAVEHQISPQKDIRLKTG